MTSRAVFFLILTAILCISGMITTCITRPEGPPAPVMIVPTEQRAAAAELVAKLVELRKGSSERSDIIFHNATEHVLKIYGEPKVPQTIPTN